METIQFYKLRIARTISVRVIKILLFLLCIWQMVVSAVAQCPENLNFNYNNLSYWSYYLQTYRGATQLNTNNASYNLPPAGVTSADRLLEQGSSSEYAIRIIPNTGSSQSTDPIAPAIKTVPNINGYQYDYSIKLGNTITGNKVRKMAYTIYVPAGSTAYTITYAYALVLQDPSHAWNQQPRFTATVRDPSKSSGQDTIKCASVSYFVPASSSDKTAQNFVQTTSSSGIYYKDWSEASVDISGYAGQTIIIEFESDDCSQGGHYGYAYFALRNDGCAAGSIAGNNIICNSGTYLYSTPPVVGASYTWSLPSGWTGSSATNAITVTPNNNSGFITVTPSKSCGSVQTRALQVTSTPNSPITPGSIKGPASVCNNSSELTYSIDSVAYASSYAWTVPNGWTVLKGGSGSSIVVSANTSSGNISVLAKNGCGTSSPSSSSLTVVNSTASIGGTISGGTSVCAGTPVTLTNSGSNGSIQNWQSSVNGGLTWTDINGNTSGSYTENSPATSALYRVKVQNGSCPVAYSSPATLVVNAIPNIMFQPSNTGICSGGTTSFSVTATGAGLTYQWQRYDGSNWTNITGAGLPNDGVTYANFTTPSLTLTSASVNMNGYLYRCVISGSCSPSITSNAAVLTVASASANINSQASNLALCQGSQALLSIAAIGTNLNYQWYANSVNSKTGGSLVTGEIRNSYTFSAATAGTTYYYCIASSTCNATTVSDTSNPAAVTVNTANTVAASISVNPATTICAGTGVTFTANTTNGGTAPIYNWTKNNQPLNISAPSFTLSDLQTNDIIGLSLQSNISCAIGNPSTAAPVTILVNPLPVLAPISGGTSQVCINATTPAFSHITSGGVWSVISGTGSASISQTGVATGIMAGEVTIVYTYHNGTCFNSVSKLLTIQPISMGGSLNSLSPVCAGNNSSTLTLSGHTGNILKWQSSVTPDFSSSINDILQTTAAITITGLSNTTYYRAVVANGACAAANSNIASIQVTQPTVGGSLNSLSPVCAGNNSSILTLSDHTGNILKWQSSVTPDFSSSINDILEVSNSLTVYNITQPTYFRTVLSNGLCTPVNSSIASIMVVAIPSIHISQDMVSIKEGDSVTLQASGALNYTWYPNSGIRTSNQGKDVIVSPLSSQKYTVSGTDINGCKDSLYVTVTVLKNITPLDGGSIGNMQVICSGTLPQILNSDKNASGSFGTIKYQWQESSDSLHFSNCMNGQTEVYQPGVLATTSYFRRMANTDNQGPVYSNIVKIRVLQRPNLAGQLQSDCALYENVNRLFSIKPAAEATHYQWTLPDGWTGNSDSSEIMVKTGKASGLVKVIPFNNKCEGTGISVFQPVLDITKIRLQAGEVSVPGDSSHTAKITLQLADDKGNLIQCSQGNVSFCSNTGSLTDFKDNHDGTYSIQVSSLANEVIICAYIDGKKIPATAQVTFTGPQASIENNGPIFASEVPKLIFQISGGKAPYKVIFQNVTSGTYDTLSDVNSGIPVTVASINRSTQYKIISITAADSTRRETNFTKDITNITVLQPKIVVSLHSDQPKLLRENEYTTRLTIKVKNTGDVNLNSVQIRANLHDVFPSPVDFQLDSITYQGNSIFRNTQFDGASSFDLLVQNEKKNNLLTPYGLNQLTHRSEAIASFPFSESAAGMLVDDGEQNILIPEYESSLQETITAENTVDNEGSEFIEPAPFYFGTLSQLSVGEEAMLFIYVRIRPNGYTAPFIMQVAAVGTGKINNSTALTNSISNDDDNLAMHPEITKKGEPFPTVIAISPKPSVGIALQTGNAISLQDGGYKISLQYTLQNFGNVNLTRLSVYQNLKNLFGSAASFRISKLYTAEGNIAINPLFDGFTDTCLLEAGSKLAFKQGGRIILELAVYPANKSLFCRIQAKLSAYCEENGREIADLSTEGWNPDPNSDGIPDEQFFSYVIINDKILPLTAGEITLDDAKGSSPVSSKSFCTTTGKVSIIEFLSATGGAEKLEFQWQISPNNQGYTDIDKANGISYSTDSLFTSCYIRRKVTSGNQTVYSSPITLLVNSIKQAVIQIEGKPELIAGGTVKLTASEGLLFTWNTGDTARVLLVNKANKYNVTIQDVNGCYAHSESVSIHPPPPSVTSATFIVGGITNPKDISVLVAPTETTGSLNYYLTDDARIKSTTPLMPGAVGSYTYYVSQTINDLESSKVPLKITMLSPVAVISFQKYVSRKAELQSDGSFLIGFSFKLINLRQEKLTELGLRDELAKAFPSPIHAEVVSLRASGNLLVNAFYDGYLRSDLLDKQSWLPGNQMDSIQLIVKVYPNGFSGVRYNLAQLDVTSINGSFTMGSADPAITASIPVSGIPTAFTIPVVDFFIPNAFSPNRDGKNDRFVIIHPYNTQVGLEIYNRWGNVVFKSNNYQNEWDGKGNQSANILGDDVPDGTYYYVIKAMDKSTGKINMFKGYLTLKRS